MTQDAGRAPSQLHDHTPAAPPSTPGPWRSRLIKQGSLGLPVVEVTPFVFRGRLYRLENWKRSWDFPGAPSKHLFHEDSVRVRDVESDQIIATVLTNHYFATAFVWEDRVYVFAGDYGQDKPRWHISEIVMTSSADLRQWTEPRVVLRHENNERMFNNSVCHDGKRFVMLYETNDSRWCPFTFKYCESQDLVNWTRIEGAIFGRDKYVGGPALYYEGGRYYTLYLHDLGNKWETRIARSTDLIHWEEAPEGRPFLTFNPENTVKAIHPSDTPYVQEINASDAELCEWQGRTLVYFTGGNQYQANDLQLAIFDGPPRELLEHFFE